jgi:hypothetical protein
VILLCLASACGRDGSRDVPGDEPEALSVTRWTARTELFAEYPPLVAGSTSRFAIHLTRLDSFKAVTDGSVEVQLRAETGTPETFRVDRPSRPGIFGVDVKPTQSGKRALVIVLRAAGLQDEHRFEVVVHPTADAARAAAVRADETPGIAFLKEQQWSLDFGTAVVREQSVRESIRIPAQLVPRPAGAADVLAPIDGRLTRVLDLPLGANVSRGQELARLLPRAAVPGDLPQLERARDEARAALSLAVRDRERAERLTSAGATPQRRHEEARAAEEQAKARVTAADASLAQQRDQKRIVGRLGRPFHHPGAVGEVIASQDGAAGAMSRQGQCSSEWSTRLRFTSSAGCLKGRGESRTMAGAEIELTGGPIACPWIASRASARCWDPEARTLP